MCCCCCFEWATQALARSMMRRMLVEGEALHIARASEVVVEDKIMTTYPQ